MMTQIEIVLFMLLALCLSDLAELRGKELSSLVWALLGILCAVTFFIGLLA